MNIPYNINLNEIFMNDCRVSNIIHFCKGDRTLELELIKQRIINGNIKYAIKLIKIFNYELLHFPNLFFLFKLQIV